jgi:hypothetical protein
MSITQLLLPAPIRRRPCGGPRDHALRDGAIEHFEAGRFAAAVHDTLQYLLPGLAIPDLASAPLCFVQGSARVRLRIDGDVLQIQAPLAQLQDTTQTTAALRFFISRLSATGQLYQPRLRDGVIALEFNESLALLHPLKLVEVLSKLPMDADRSDGWLIEQFGVAMPDREPVAALGDDEFERAHAVWVKHWGAVDEMVAHSRRRRSIRFLGAVGAYALHQLSYSLPLFGTLRARLADNARVFNDGDVDPNKRESALAKCVKAMRGVSPAELRACLGHATYAISPLQDGSPSLLTSILDNSERVQAVDELRAAGQMLEATLELLAAYLYLLALHAWPPQIEQRLRNGLELASAKPWRDAAELLAHHAHATVERFGSHGARAAEETEAAYT